MLNKLADENGESATREDAKKQELQDISCLTPAKYLSGFVFLRDVPPVCLFAASICILVGAINAVIETSYFKDAYEVKDGNFSAGRTAFTLFAVGFLLSAITNAMCVLLTAVASMKNSNAKYWWPENKRVDLIVQLSYLIIDILITIFFFQGVSRYSVDNDLSKMSCSSADEKKACAVAYMAEHQLIYGYDLLIRRDISDSMSHFDVIGRKLNVMFFNEICTALWVLFLIRFCVFIVLWIGGQRPFKICCYNDACFQVCGESGSIGMKKPKDDEDYIECPCNIGGLISPYVHDQLGSLRNHDLVGSLLFAVAFFVLATSLGNDQITGSYIPRKLVVEDTKIGGSPVVPACAWRVPYNPDKPYISLFTSFGSIELTPTATASATIDNSEWIAVRSALTSLNSTYATSALPELRMNQLVCINPDTKRQDAMPGDDCYLAQGTLAPSYENTLTNDNDAPDQSKITKAKTTASMGSTKACPADDASQNTLNEQDGARLVHAYECCMGSDVYPDNENDDIGSRFVAYSMLLLVGAILCVVSATAFCIATTGYSIRARTRHLPQYDGSTPFWPF